MTKQLKYFSIIVFSGLVVSVPLAIIASILSFTWENLAIALMAVFSTFATVIFGVWISKAQNKTTQIDPILDAAINWLKLESTTVRTEHKLKLTLELLKTDFDNFVKIVGIHEYTVHSPYAKCIFDLSIDVYTDLGVDLGNITDDVYNNLRAILGLNSNLGVDVPLGIKLSGGFTEVRHNGKPVGISDKIRYEKTKARFIDKIRVNPADKATFEYHTYGLYRLKDRLVWTVQELSDGFTVTVENGTQLPFGNLLYWINHHDREVIKIDKPFKTVDVIEFLCPVFPYQGFEMSWDFQDTD